MKKAGILMHITSLPSEWGIGTFGSAAYSFVDFLSNAKQSYWQILPLGVTSYGDSPYQSPSTFAGNHNLIDLDILCREGLLERSEFSSIDWGTGNVDFSKIYEHRIPVLRKAFSRFKPTEEYLDFCRENSYWLEDYALFMSIKLSQGGTAWCEWEKKFRLKNSGAIRKFRREHADEIELHRFLQYKFACQWRALKDYANKRGIEIIGDLPIYVAYDSADVWTNPRLFDLTAERLPRRVAACPPDYFSATGQLWGNPVYDWAANKKENYAWWEKRLARAMSLYDIVRIDHFRGFESFYSVPYGSPDAVNGYWTKGPDIAFFDEMRRRFPRTPIIAENLGFLTDDARALHAASGFPGMKVLEFAFDGNPDNENLPPHIDPNTVLYIGSHDNPPVEQWKKTISDFELNYMKKRIKITAGESLPWALARFAFSTVAETVIIQLQDYLCLGEGSRMNEPATLGGNWSWRVEKGAYSNSLASRIAALTERYGRA